MKMYYEKDVNINILKDKTIAVIGYGSQGMAQSRNMHESGLKWLLVSEKMVFME